MKNILKLEKVGDLVKVKDGYGRNYLIKNGVALRASKENIDFVNKKKDELNKKNNEIKKTFVDLAKKINGKSLSFSKESKENGDLFASIKPKEISSYYKENLNVEITPSQIVLKQEINKIVKYKITINLHSEVSTENTILVKKREIK